MGGAEWRVVERICKGKNCGQWSVGVKKPSFGEKTRFQGGKTRFRGGSHNVGGASCPDPPSGVYNKNRGKGISIALIIHSLDPPTEVGCGGRCPPYDHGTSFFLKVVFQVVDVVLVECFDFVFYLGEAFVHSVL